MASEIRIKRSGLTTAPATLKSGELAYSYVNGVDKLYFGKGDNGSGVATAVVSIGGELYVNMLDHQAGVLTASSALVVDANGKLDILNVDNLTLNGNTLSSTDTNGDINLTPNGTGKVVATNLYIGTDSIAEYILDTVGGAITAGSGIDVVNNDGANTSTISLNTEYAQDLVGAMVGAGSSQTNITVTYDDTNGTLGFSVPAATTTTLGVASFNTDNFTVAAGAVSTKNITLGTSTLTNGSTTTSLAGLQQLTVDNIDINGNTISSTNTNGNIVLDPNGSGTVEVSGAKITNVGTPTADTDATTKSYVDTAVSNAVSGATSTATLTIKGDAATTEGITLASETLAIVGGTGISTTVSSNTLTISGDDATTSEKGIASFSADNFAVANGVVTIKDGGVANAELVNDSTTLGSTELVLGATVTTLAGLIDLTVGELNLNGSAITATGDGDLNVVLAPKGAGTVDVSDARITSLADPTAAQDAATKAYVDSVATGLDVKGSVRAATTADITLSGTQTVDGVTLVAGNRVLVKDQTDATQNGIYVVAGGAWTRAADFDNSPGIEITSGAFTFVEEGTTQQNNGYAVVTDGVITLGTTAIVWNQFSGAGQIIAGAALTKSGNTLDVVVAANGGIEISGDALQLKSTVAGAGLTYANGVIDVVGTANRITVNDDSVDIASTYVGQASITTVGTLTSGALGTGFTTVAVPQGGTGLSTITARGVVFGNGTSAVGVTGTSSIDGSFLREDSEGNPYWSNVIDGGTF